MSIHVALNHVTDYRYDRLVALSPHVVRLRPAPHSRTRILSYSMRIEPARHFINWQQDPQSNYLARVVFPDKTRQLRIEVDLVAEMAVLNPFDFFLEPHATQFPFAYTAEEQSELAAYLVKRPAGPLLTAYLASVPRESVGTANFLVDLNSRLSRDVRYLIRLEPGVQTPEETLTNASGSCRDTGWLLVQLLRHLGLAARFASGYLIQLAADVKSLDGPSGPSSDFADLHAWCEVYLPGAGWIGLDPTSGLLAGEGHIPLACTPEPSAAAPVSGSVDDCEVEFVHTLRVDRVWEAPRVTKPYTQEQWSEIEILGVAIDADLEALDVRLTMGGEPTFVSADDPDGAEWNTAALGENKRTLAVELFERLRQRYAPDGLAHFGQGKWYPGEQLPRWSLNCFWRRDGEAIWRNHALMAHEAKGRDATAQAAQEFLAIFAEQLGLARECVFAAYEDPFYYEWREQRLPANVDGKDARLDDAQEGARLARLFDKGFERVAGYVLPIARDAADAHWQTGAWFLRRERCFLLPGDSPLGMRLPLDSLPWAKPEDRPQLHVPDPTQAFAPLPPYEAIRARLGASGARGSDASRRPKRHESAKWIARTAICAEPRAGVLYIFMPPTGRVEDYLELIAACEAAAGILSQPVIIEGYEPPRDPRLNSFRVTPDPGVIEVNIHPSARWQELVDRTTHLYGAARATRLTSE